MKPLPSYAHPDLWLDDDHAVEFLTYPGEAAPYGAHLWHRPGPNKPEPLTANGWCLGAVHWSADHGPNWTLVSLEPLHVEPSIQCGCGAHGFIREGRWQPA